MVQQAFQDSVGLKGSLRLRIKRHGQVVEEWEDDNLVVDIPRAEIALAIARGGTVLSVTHVAVGTNGNAPARSDTAITGAFIKPLMSVGRPTPTSVRCDFVILTTDAIGMTIREFGLLRSNGTLFARRTRGAIEKSDDLEIEGQWTIMM